MIDYNDLIIGEAYKITEVIADKQVNRNAYTGKKGNIYTAKLIAKDDETLCLTFDKGNGWEKDIYYDHIGHSKRTGTKNIEFAEVK